MRLVSSAAVCVTVSHGDARKAIILFCGRCGVTLGVGGCVRSYSLRRKLCMSAAFRASKVGSTRCKKIV